MNLFYLFASTASYAVCNTIPQYWLQLWTESDGTNTTFYTIGFLFLAAISWFATSAQMWYVSRRLLAAKVIESQIGL
jgi:ATP-binding cassette subfamily C (CFTR/MRP) protein 1